MDLSFFEKDFFPGTRTRDSFGKPPPTAVRPETDFTIAATATDGKIILFPINSTHIKMFCLISGKAKTKYTGGFIKKLTDKFRMGKEKTSG